MGLDEVGLSKLDQIIENRKRIFKGHAIYRAGDPFKNLYVVRLGHLKIFQTDPQGHEHVTGFLMPGELLGLEAIGTGYYQCHAVALEDSEICELPFARLESLLIQIPSLQQQFHRLMSQEITREQKMILLLGNMKAEQKLATFFIQLANRYAARGYSATSFQLRMTREEIGNYLGLTLESISRLFSRFKQHQLIQVDQKKVTILNTATLHAMAAGESPPLPEKITP